MEMDFNFWLQFAIVMVCVAIGGRLGGVGLGAAGGLGVCLLVLVLGVPPGSPPISVLLIITAVIACTSVLQGSGGLDLMVRWAEKLLRRWPKMITIVGPLVCSFFVMVVGTSYVAFAVYPVVAEVAASARVRPERAVSASVICAGIAVMASPMSAAMAAMVGIMATQGVEFHQILAVTIPTFILSLFCAALSVFWRGKELEDDPEFKARLANGDYQWLATHSTTEMKFAEAPFARRAVCIFLLGILVSILVGSVSDLRPSWTVGEKTTLLPIPNIIQMVMLATAFFIIMLCRVPSAKFASGSVFRSGLIGVVGVFGIAWCTGTFFDQHTKVLADAFAGLAKDAPFVFCLATFCVSTVIFSPTVSTTIMIPLGLKFGLPPEFLVGTWACCYGDFIIPGGAQIGCTAFDRTGTTRLGTFVINHSYLRPGPRLRDLRHVHRLGHLQAGLLIGLIPKVHIETGVLHAGGRPFSHSVECTKGRGFSIRRPFNCPLSSSFSLPSGETERGRSRILPTTLQPSPRRASLQRP